jgi:hypothetical protein
LNTGKGLSETRRLDTQAPHGSTPAPEQWGMLELSQVSERLARVETDLEYIKKAQDVQTCQNEKQLEAILSVKKEIRSDIASQFDKFSLLQNQTTTDLSALTSSQSTLNTRINTAFSTTKILLGLGTVIFLALLGFCGFLINDIYSSYKKDISVLGEMKSDISVLKQESKKVDDIHKSLMIIDTNKVQNIREQAGNQKSH